MSAMPTVVETGGEADFGQAGVRLNAHAIGKRQVQNLAAGRAETPDDRQVNRAIGRLQNQSAVHHVFDGVGHAGAGGMFSASLISDILTHTFRRCKCSMTSRY